MSAKTKMKVFQDKLRKYENSLKDPRRITVRIVEFGEHDVIPGYKPGVRVIDLVGGRDEQGMRQDPDIIGENSEY